MDLKRSQGEDLNKWVHIGVLYKRAVDLLSNGKLPYDGGPNPNTELQGQEPIAKCIQEWVRHQLYLNLIKLDNFSKDQKYHCAMEGFLYQQAVRLLKQGHFPVLNAKETAKAIQNWVEIELIKRCSEYIFTEDQN